MPEYSPASQLDLNPRLRAAVESAERGDWRHGVIARSLARAVRAMDQQIQELQKALAEERAGARSMTLYVKPEEMDGFREACQSPGKLFDAHYEVFGRVYDPEPLACEHSQSDPRGCECRPYCYCKSPGNDCNGTRSV